MGAEARFTVVLNDAEGERAVLPGVAGASAGIVSVAAQAVGLGREAGRAVRVAVVDSGDGSYVCVYTPVDE